MSDADALKGLRDRLAGSTEERLGRALSDLFENTLLNGALGRASDAREKAVQAQELAMGALNLPSAADIERLTRRLRSVSQRLERIEDGVHRLGRNLSGQSIEARLAAIEAQLQTLSRKLEGRRPGGAQPEAQKPAAAKPAAKRSAAKRPAAKRTKPTR
jgi:TolA-binding protein